MGLGSHAGGGVTRRDLLAGGVSLAALLAFARAVPAGAAEAGWRFTDVGINLQGVPLPETIERFGELAEALGADLAAAEVVQARQEFEAASEALRQAAAGKAGLDVLVAAPFAEGFYVTKPADAWDLAYWQRLGVNIVEPGGPDPYFELLSWEEADRYPAGLILVDARAQPDEYAQRPTWLSLPAVQAGQLGTWRTAAPTSYQEATAVLTELAELVTESRTDVV